MPESLERMNLKLHDVISDLTGGSGLQMVQAILAGERRLEAEPFEKARPRAIKQLPG